MGELEEYLRKGKNCTLTEGMIQKILELATIHGNNMWENGRWDQMVQDSRDGY